MVYVYRHQGKSPAQHSTAQTDDDDTYPYPHR
jgi:hypothetical protein